MVPNKRDCAECGSEFRPKQPTQKYCSKRCRKRASDRRHRQRQRRRELEVASEEVPELKPKKIEREHRRLFEHRGP